MSVGVDPHSNQFETFLDVDINSKNKTNINLPKEKELENDSAKTKKIVGTLIGLGVIGASMFLCHKKTELLKNQKFLEDHKEFENVSSRIVSKLRDLNDKVSKFRSDVDKAYEKFAKDQSSERKELAWQESIAKWLEQDIAYCEASLEAKCGINAESLMREKSGKQTLLNNTKAKIAELKKSIRTKTISNNARNMDRLATRISDSSQN